MPAALFPTHLISTIIHRHSTSPQPAYPHDDRTTAQRVWPTLHDPGGTQIDIQPCPTPDERTQDRHFIADWQLPNGLWRFRAVFDGHGGHETVDLTVRDVPTAIHDALVAIVTEQAQPEPSVISDLLRDTVAGVDAKIGEEFLALFPGGADAVEKMTEEEIVAIINDDGPNNLKTVRCMRGSTVLVSLVSPDLDVWVASLGDCPALLGVKDASGDWTAKIMGANHNGVDAAEAARVRSEHPGEDETCILRDRVLGALAVTRAMGDFEFKLPGVYTAKVFLKSNPGFRITSKVEEFLPRNLTPPYVSAICDVQHVNVKALGATGAYLLVASDGLVDLSGDEYGMDHREPENFSKKWVEILARPEATGNRALYLLRDAMGQTAAKVSSLLTVESETRWMDDTTVIYTSLIE
uniref:Serine/threonine protein phosphatase 2C n=1 Tax=Mycena chlorophos TaxID=658473 RepID=A0ABQ0M373_MYCCL|nr:serine/threonine protein phosphatase 2C [Mycena chlorophos]